MAFQRILNGHEWALPAASAINPNTPVQLAGTDVPFFLPCGTVNARPYGVNGVATAGASGLNQNEAVTAFEPGNIAKVISVASIGVSTEVAVASSNGAVGAVSLIAASAHWALGVTMSSAGAGEVLSILIQPRKV